MCPIPRRSPFQTSEIRTARLFEVLTKVKFPYIFTSLVRFIKKYDPKFSKWSSLVCLDFEYDHATKHVPISALFGFQTFTVLYIQPFCAFKHYCAIGFKPNYLDFVKTLKVFLKLDPGQNFFEDNFCYSWWFATFSTAALTSRLSLLRKPTSTNSRNTGAIFQ